MISVMIASIGRPSLAATLSSLARARVPEGEAVEIIIADDGPSGQVQQVLARLDVPLDIRLINVSAQNVSTSRNACLDAARGEWLIFVDDDETVESDWLEGHLSSAREFGADAVFGPVYPVYPQQTPAWFLAANPLFQDWRWTEEGREVRYGRTGNTLLRRSALGDLRFDPAFGRSGGEDHDFFMRFAAAGHRMVVTNRARAHEEVPAERATAGYVLRRAARTGQIHAVLRLRGQGRLARLAFAADAAAKLVVATVASVILRPFSRPRSFRLLMRSASNFGKLRGVSGAGLMSAWT